ncbi:MAG: zf-HC2 domain-containing protein [Acidobacteria bacterium]|jgi:anti-sigma factor RsiW|nr:zf-HC2 domain-containing protein [Acidobacteriota bacterium]
MNCREISEFLMDYVGNTLDQDVQQTFQAHLTQCTNCYEYLSQYRETIKAGQLACHDDDVSELPDDLVRAVLAALSKEPRT